MEVSFSSSNLSSNANSANQSSSKSSNAINGPCEKGIGKNSSSILEFSMRTLHLKNHSIVSGTDLPQYRSFSFGEAVQV